MKREDINIRDPFILPYEGKYYLYGSRGSEVWEDNATGLDVYVSDDLENWSEPKEIFTRTADFWADRHYWAPEVMRTTAHSICLRHSNRRTDAAELWY